MSVLKNLNGAGYPYLTSPKNRTPDDIENAVNNGEMFMVAVTDTKANLADRIMGADGWFQNEVLTNITLNTKYSGDDIRAYFYRWLESIKDLEDIQNKGFGSRTYNCSGPYISFDVAFNARVGFHPVENIPLIGPFNNRTFNIAKNVIADILEMKANPKAWCVSGHIYHNCTENNDCWNYRLLFAKNETMLKVFGNYVDILLQHATIYEFLGRIQAVDIELQPMLSEPCPMVGGIVDVDVESLAYVINTFGDKQLLCKNNIYAVETAKSIYHAITRYKKKVFIVTGDHRLYYCDSLDCVKMAMAIGGFDHLNQEHVPYMLLEVLKGRKHIQCTIVSKPTMKGGYTEHDTGERIIMNKIKCIMQETCRKIVRYKDNWRGV